MTIFLAILQSLSLLALAATVYVAARQLKAATEQARASEEQAKSSEKMAQFSLQQTELLRAQIHASFRPVVTVTGEYGHDNANMTIKNFGTGPALGLVAIYRNGVRQSLGNLAAEQGTAFRFDYSNNLIPRPVGHFQPVPEPSPNERAIPLRLEYQSVSGAKCWTTVKFDLRSEGPIEPEIEPGMDIPSLTATP